MVALAIAGIVVVGAHQILAGVADAANSISVARENLDRQANARRWLKDAFLSLDPPFEGRVDHVSFTSWHMVARGWLEPHPTELLLEEDQFVAQGNGSPIDLARGVRSLAFDYLLDPGENTRWVREWISPVSAPLAVRVRITGCGRRDPACADTLLFLIKERG